MEYKGLHGKDYHYTRLNIPAVKFSLQCRIEAINEGILKLHSDNVNMMLDLGSADGLLATGIMTLTPRIKHFFALDMDHHLLRKNPLPSAQGDCCRMPFAGETFDVITAAAIIEHLPDPMPLLNECKRVLRPGGVLFMTTPAPFFEWLATKIGYLKNAGHFHRYSIKDLKTLAGRAGFTVVYKKKFMFSPISVPGYKSMETAMNKIGLSFLMLNQVVGCRKEE